MSIAIWAPSPDQRATTPRRAVTIARASISALAVMFQRRPSGTSPVGSSRIVYTMSPADDSPNGEIETTVAGSQIREGIDGHGRGGAFDEAPDGCLVEVDRLESPG